MNGEWLRSETGVKLIPGHEWISKCHRWMSCDVREWMEGWGTDGGKAGARGRWMNGRSADGAHLLFGLLLVAADLQVILQHPAQRQRDTCYCRRDLLSARIRSDAASHDLQFPLKNLSWQTDKLHSKSSAGGSCWGMRQWTVDGALRCSPDVRLLEFGEWSQIVFSPGNFLSDNCWPTAKNSLETQRTCSAEIRLSVGAVHGYFRGLWLVKKKKKKGSMRCVCFILPKLEIKLEQYRCI